MSSPRNTCRGARSCGAGAAIALPPARRVLPLRPVASSGEAADALRVRALPHGAILGQWTRDGGKTSRCRRS